MGGSCDLPRLQALSEQKKNAEKNLIIILETQKTGSRGALRRGGHGRHQRRKKEKEKQAVFAWKAAENGKKHQKSSGLGGRLAERGQLGYARRVGAGRRWRQLTNERRGEPKDTNPQAARGSGMASPPPGAAGTRIAYPCLCAGRNRFPKRTSQRRRTGPYQQPECTRRRKRREM